MKNDESKRLTAEEILEVLPDGLTNPKSLESQVKLLASISEEPQDDSTGSENAALGTTMRRRVNISSLPDSQLVELIKSHDGDPNGEETVQSFVDLWEFHGG